MGKKISFVGAGSITEAVISGVLQKKLYKSGQIFVTNKTNLDRLQYLKEKYNVQYERDINDLINNSNIIILSVKPADIYSAINAIKDYVNSSQLIISLIAGVSTELIEKGLELDVPVIRAMPNTSAAVGYSATAICAGKFANKEHIGKSVHLFNTIGTTVVVDEKHMDIVTGISGSGPAYIYYLVEAMERAAIEQGLDQDIALSLITQTIIGAGKMLDKSKESAEKLRKKVTSPGGTTEAAIKTLAEQKFQEAMIKGVKSAINRSAELGENK